MKDEIGQSNYRKLLYYFENKIKIHFKDSDNIFYNGLILEHSDKHLIMNDRVVGDVFVFYSEIKKIDNYKEISLGTNKYVIDTRPVVIQRARVLKSRAKLEKWKISFTIVYSEQLIADPQIIKTVLEEAGQRIGIMDFRPQKAGMFGCFNVIKFTE